MSTSRWRWFGLVLVIALALIAVPGLIRAQSPSGAEGQQAEPAAQPSTSTDQTVQQQKTPPTNDNQSKETQKAALAKLHPDLRDVATGASPAFASDIDQQVSDANNNPVFVTVYAAATSADAVDLGQYFVDGNVHARPGLGHGDVKLYRFVGQIQPTNLLKVAGIQQVQAINPVSLEVEEAALPYPPDEKREFPEKTQEDWAELRLQADELRNTAPDWQDAKAFGDGRTDFQRQDWFEVTSEGPHKAEVAWSRGYTGTGVTVGVLDDGIDAAHPDLMGTQKIYSSTAAPEYNGWPMVFSPLSQQLYFLDEAFGTSYIADAFPSVHYVDTSATPATSACGAGISCFNFTPLIDYGVPNPFAPAGGYTYVYSNTMSKSGVVHVGTHPDNDIRDYVLGEKPAVLVTDPNTKGVYDTVLVDLDGDYDFRDEKPLTRADVTDPSSYNDMIAYRDVNGDGLADISGGMVYFIADGQNPIPASDWEWGASCAAGFMCPGNGDLVAFSSGTFDRPYSHGTQCASNIAGQGITQNPAMGAPNNDMLPEFIDLNPGPGADRPTGAVQGMAPGAKLVNISDIYYDFDNSRIDAYIFAAVGYDAIDQTGFDLLNLTGGNTDTDAIQITTNSYGSSDVDNDGWDYFGQLSTHVQRAWAPNLQFLFSTGNGASAYGTTAPPAPAGGIGVGASTQFGSTGWDSITSTTQIMNNDVTPFSNRGPGARGTAGVDVVAGGAFAGGDEELNYYSISTWGQYNGNLSWNSWGGTSRSAPVAGGVLALLYQAYYDANGTWPTYDQAKAMLMSTSTDLDYDTFTQGAGSVNADRGTAVAGGHYGLFVDEQTWNPGDYRGTDYPGFAHIAYPGDVFSEDFTVENTGMQTITASINDTEMNLIRSESFTYTVTEQMVADESVYGASNRDNFFKAFNYFIPITGSPSADSSWHNIDVPADTDLMVVRQTFPYDQFDTNEDYSWDNRFYLSVYNWMDVDNDGLVWDDSGAEAGNNNGVVNFINDPSTFGQQIDGAVELAWDDSRTELDRYEFGRFSYHRPGGNRNEMWVQNPLDRMHDGLFIGLRHHPGSTYTGTTHLSYRIDFYKEENGGWLSTNTNSLEIGPGQSETFTATATVPNNIEPGMYEAGIEIHDSGMGMTYTADTSVIPVVLNVAAPFADGMQLGGMDTYTQDQDSPYNNAAVRGLFDWTWRAESGDWRFFMTDVDNTGQFTAALQSGNEVPPVTSSAVGTATMTYDAASGRLDYTLDVSGVTSTVAAAHIHSGAAGTNGPVEYWLYDASGTQAPGGSFPVQDTVYIDAQHHDDLLNGDLYVNVHSSAHPAGEVRDQIHRADSGRLYPPSTQMLIKDEWNDAAPHTDIDTILLGPSSSRLGSDWYSFGDPSYFGPYVLDTVAKSPNTNAGGGTWIFDTSTGSNEDWIAGPIQDGLHELLQHNVLFEGDKIDVVFTKTVGTLQSSPQSFDIKTYADSGQVGVVDVQSSLALNGLQAEGFGLGAPEVMADIPLDFISSNTIEWTQVFQVQHGAKIELSTSSSNISDIDLYLFYCGPAGASCSQRAASTTGTANEHIEIIMPEDGIWIIGVNNWSGPAGTFNLTKNVVQGFDLSTSGVPTGTIAADSPVSFTLNYSRSMQPGQTYEGLLLFGPPEAPALNEVPVTIEQVAALEQLNDVSTTYRGADIVYTYRLNNVHDPDTVHFESDIPANTDFVSVENATQQGNSIVFDGTLAGTRLITLTVNVTDSVATGTKITNTATMTASTLFDDERSVQSVSTVGGADLSTSAKTGTAETATGDVIDYTITITNTGNQLVTAQFTDTLPMSTTFVSKATPPPSYLGSFAYDSGNNAMTWSGDVPPGAVRTFTYRVQVDADPSLWGQDLSNSATVTWEDGTANMSATTSIVPPYQQHMPLIFKQ